MKIIGQQVLFLLHKEQALTHPLFCRGNLTVRLKL